MSSHNRFLRIPNREPLLWEETGPGRYETQADDGSLWCHSVASGMTTETTDLHEPDSEMASNMHNSALDHMASIDD